MGIARVQKRFAKQTAVYWGSPEDDGMGGKTFAVGREIKVKWEEGQELFTDKQGKERKSHTQVYPLEDLDLDGMLFLGTLTALSSTGEADPQDQDDAFVIKGFQKVSNSRGTEYDRKIWL